MGGAGHIVLDQHSVLQHRDLSAVAGVADEQSAVDALASGQELRLGDDRAAPHGVAALAPALPLGLQPRRAADGCDVAGHRPGVAHLDNGAGRVVDRGGQVLLAAATTTATAAAGGPAAARLVGVVTVVGLGVLVAVVVGFLVLDVGRLLAVHGLLALGPATFAAPATPAAAAWPPTRTIVGLLVAVDVIGVEVLGGVFGVLGVLDVLEVDLGRCGHPA